MATIVNDGFTRANNATSLGTADSGQAWVSDTPSSLWGISSNTAQSQNAASGLTTVNSAVADCTVTAVLTLGTNTTGGVAWRATDSSNYFFLYLNSGAVYKYVAGSLTGPVINGGYSGAGTAGTYSVILLGSSHTLQRNGTTVGTATDTFNQTATKHGLSNYSSVGVTATSFSVTTPASAVNPVPPVIRNSAMYRASLR